MFELIDDPSVEYVVITAPRGVGKTTIMKILACKYIHFQEAKFICYISKSEGHAILQTEDIKNKLITSRLGKKWFPKIKVKPSESRDGLEEEFSKKSWVAGGNTIIMPRGSGQQVRGLNWRDYRPDLFIVDDLEDTQNIKNEVIRKERYNWFYTDVLEARQQIRDKKYQKQNFKMIYIDTVKHEGALIEDLFEDPRFEHLRLSVCDENEKTLFPVHWPQEELNKKIKYHRETRTMDLFAMEWLCEPIATEDSAFSKDYFKYYDEDDREFLSRCRNGKIRNVVIGDPAKTAKMHNAQSGLVVWGVDVKSNALYMREARGEFWHPNEFYDALLEASVRYNAIATGVEVTGLNEFIQQPLANEVIRKNLNVNLVWCKARSGKGELTGLDGGKDGRIRALLPYYRQGLVYHNRVGTLAYEQQLISFPKSKRKDIMDAAAYIVQMLELGNIYFQSGLKTEDEYDVEEEYKDIKYDAPLDDWVETSEFEDSMYMF
jgi:hypothetical protein